MRSGGERKGGKVPAFNRGWKVFEAHRTQHDQGKMGNKGSLSIKFGNPVPLGKLCPEVDGKKGKRGKRGYLRACRGCQELQEFYPHRPFQPLPPFHPFTYARGARAV